MKKSLHIIVFVLILGFLLYLVPPIQMVINEALKTQVAPFIQLVPCGCTGSPVCVTNFVPAGECNEEEIKTTEDNTGSVNIGDVDRGGLGTTSGTTSTNTGSATDLSGQVTTSTDTNTDRGTISTGSTTTTEETKVEDTGTVPISTGNDQVIDRGDIDVQPVSTTSSGTTETNQDPQPETEVLLEVQEDASDALEAIQLSIQQGLGITIETQDLFLPSESILEINGGYQDFANFLVYFQLSQPDFDDIQVLQSLIQDAYGSSNDVQEGTTNLLQTLAEIYGFGIDEQGQFDPTAIAVLSSVLYDKSDLISVNSGFLNIDLLEARLNDQNQEFVLENLVFVAEESFEKFGGPQVFAPVDEEEEEKEEEIVPGGPAVGVGAGDGGAGGDGGDGAGAAGAGAGGAAGGPGGPGGPGAPGGPAAGNPGGSVPGVTGSYSLQSVLDGLACPVGDYLKEFDYGTADGVGIPTSTEDAPHLITDPQFFVVKLGPGVDSPEWIREDKGALVDFDGMNMNTSSPSILNLDITHIVGNSLNLDLPATTYLGTVIAGLYTKNRQGSYDFEVIGAESVRGYNDQLRDPFGKFPDDITPPPNSPFQLSIDQRAFEEDDEGWLMVIYTSADVVTYGFDLDEIFNWNGTHQNLMEIFNVPADHPFDPTIPPGEVEDYRFCYKDSDEDGEADFSFYTPTDETYFDHCPSDGSEDPNEAICDNVRDDICSDPFNRGGIGNFIPNGNPQPTPDPSFSDFIDGLLNQYQQDPGRGTAEKRLEYMYQFMSGALPTVGNNL